jgi:protocatechuate 3,4-dioxygenase, beta subunit
MKSRWYQGSTMSVTLACIGSLWSFSGVACSRPDARAAADQESQDTIASRRQRPNLYDCEGCEAIYEHSHDALDWRVRIAGPNEPGEPLVLSGRIYKTDGKTPAPGVVLYAYHTDNSGLYRAAKGATGWGTRHGRLRGWLKTDSTGRYEITTIRPKPYPNATVAAHVHPILKEPGRREYWIDEYVFDDDKFVTEAYLSHQEKRGGSGLVHLTRDAKGVWRGTRDIVLEW